MTTTILSDDPRTITNTGFHWGAVIAGAVVAAATGFFLITLGAGFGLVLSSPNAAGTFLTLGAIWVLAAQAFGFAAGAHVTGRLIGPARETSREEEWRAGSHGLVMWAITVVAGLALLALAVAGGSPMHQQDTRSTSSISAYWSDVLLAPVGEHAMAKGEDLDHDKTEASRVLAADLHPGATARAENHADLMRLTMLDAGLSAGEADARVNFVENRMRQELDTARKAAGYAALWTALALLFGAVLSVAAAIFARWEDDKLHFTWARRY
ncbi:MAG: hypothetical protein JWN16_1604 [Alphaproteobacteria bacterium]|jgi:hypothetical protein|nr:hypothetical protein [Alphaproteobacteria bacterium]